MPKIKVRLSICGADYILIADDDEDYVRCIADEVEKRMQAVMEENPRASITTAAVLTALDCYDLYYKSNLSADHLRGQIKDYLTESSRSRAGLEDARRQIQALHQENETLKKQLAAAVSPSPASQQTDTPASETADPNQVVFDQVVPSHTPKTISADQFLKMAGHPDENHE